MLRVLLVLVVFVSLACQSSHSKRRQYSQANHEALIALLSQPPQAGLPQAGPTTAGLTPAAALAGAENAHRRLAETITAVDGAIRVCEFNLANAQTTAYKATRPGTDPAGRPLLRTDWEQGALENTGRPLDVGIAGAGFFKVKITDSRGDGLGYTRNGNFFVNKDGDLVLGMGDRYRLEPKITTPKNTMEITIAQNGRVEALIAGSANKMTIGQIQLRMFMNPDGLSLISGSLYTEGPQSGEAMETRPGENGAGQLMQGFLESSNVDLTRERLRIKTLNEWRAVLMKIVDERR